MKSKANELWETVIRLETEKYDLEERGKRQGHDVRATQFQILFKFQFLQFLAESVERTTDTKIAVEGS